MGKGMGVFLNWQPRQESNLDQTFRKRLFYPLNYGASRQRNSAHSEARKSPDSREERGRGLVWGKGPLGGVGNTGFEPVTFRV